MKKIIAVVMTVLILFTFAGCGDFESVGTGKANEIKVHVYDGGFGYKWLEDLAKDYNDSVLKDTDYEITVYATRDMPEVLIPGLANEVAPYQLYISETCEWGSAIMKDYLVDLSDIAQEEVDGAGNGTVASKIKNYEDWKSVFSKKGEGLYALPWSVSLLGMVYEHEEFLENNWYFEATEEADGQALTDQGIVYQEITNPTTLETYLSFVSSEEPVNYKLGDKILSAGKDGKYGTYDDGQPETLEQFDVLLDRIRDSRVTPFIWTGESDSYMDTVFNALFAQIGGQEVYDTFYNYHSSGNQVELADGTVREITIDEGYLVKQLKALKDTYEFFENYFDYSNPALKSDMHFACTDSSSHYDAQNFFLLGYRGDSKNPNTAILFDGIWWQNEANTMFNELEAFGRGKYQREYRYLLPPEMPGQATPKDKTVFSTTTSGSIAIPKNQSEQSLNYVKDFVKLLLKEESLRYVARTSGHNLAYNYTLTDEDYEAMTPFQKNVAELYADTEHIEVKKEQLDIIRSPLTFASSKGYKNLLYPLIQGTYPYSTINTIINYDLDTIVSGLADSYKASDWVTYMREARDNGYFTA